MSDNNPTSADRAIQFLTMRRSIEDNPAIPTHMHAPSLDFDHQQHNRNDSAALRSPFDTPKLRMGNEDELTAFPENPHIAHAIPFPRFDQGLATTPLASRTPANVLTPNLLGGGPGPIVSSSEVYSTGLTPLLQSSPLFPANAFQSQPTTVKQEQQEFPTPNPMGSGLSSAHPTESSTEDTLLRRESLPDVDAMAFDFSDTKSSHKSETTGDSKRSSMYVEDEPPMKRRSTVVSSSEPLISPLEETNFKALAFDIPGNDYDDPLTYSMQWTEEDNFELRKLLEEAEKVKWNYMSDQLFEAIGKRIPPSACHRKFCDLFGVPENTTLLGSSLNYIAYRDGWSVLKNLEISEQKFPIKT